MFGNYKTIVVAAIAAGLIEILGAGAQAEDVLSIARGKHEITIGTSNDAPALLRQIPRTTAPMASCLTC